MAGDWIKWECGLHRKIEVLTTARALGIEPVHAAGLWMLLWEWADAQTQGGDLPGISAEQVDGLVGYAGFAEVGARVGWLEFDDDGLILPNFLRHNGQSAKKRAIDAYRKRAARG